ncbi:hypothetical protein KB206_17490 [Microvirga sp. STS02]|uniref:hypothetical protein n=1 Tax=Hymenobacter negativus TaxID=2795026 RepID=UPI0018DCBB27|nr:MULTISPECIES: hypothetical protein [Bacteria]MBH8570690.1 hypothetical protein [Hymenobacter negativus]MBR7210428.1 hypothetical protein [Microvirga sp. STS02]
MSSIPLLIVNLSPVPLVVACVVGLVRYRRYEAVRRYLVWLSWLALLVTAVAMWLQRQHRPNLFLAPIDTAIEFTLLGLIYRRVLWPHPVAQYLPVGIGLFVVGTALTSWPRPGIVEFSPIQHFIESVAMLLLVVLYYRRVLKALPVSLAPLEREPVFWISAGVFLYFSANSLIFLTSNLVLFHSKELSLNIWAIHALLYAFLNGFFIVALCLPSQLPDVTQS